MFSPNRIVVCLLFIALLAPSAAAASSGAGGCSACDQYREPPAPSGGSKAGSKTKSAKLPKATEKALKSAKNVKSTKSSTRKKIEAIVTLSNLGAPTSSIPTAQNPDSSLFRSLGASIVSPGSGSVGRLAILLAAIIGITAVIATTAVRKQRIQR